MICSVTVGYDVVIELCIFILVCTSIISGSVGTKIAITAEYLPVQVLRCELVLSGKGRAAVVVMGRCELTSHHHGWASRVPGACQPVHWVSG